MTPDESKRLAGDIAMELKAMQTHEQDFWIDGEKHYQDHIKFCGWIVFFETWQKDLNTAVRALIITGVVGIIGAGIYFAANG